MFIHWGMITMIRLVTISQHTKLLQYYWLIEYAIHYSLMTYFVTGFDLLAWLRGATPRPRSGTMAESARLQQHRSGQNELPYIRGQGQWPLPPAWGQGWRLGGATPLPRGSGCTDAGGPRGASPLSRSGGVAVRIYPLSKVWSCGCTLLEQPWRDTPHPR